MDLPSGTIKPAQILNFEKHGGPIQPIIVLENVQKKVNKTIKQFKDDCEKNESSDYKDLWAQNCQNKTAFVEKLGE